MAGRLEIAMALSGAMLLALTASTMAQDREGPSNRRWQTMDQCSKDSWTAHPDYTAEGAAKREEFLRRCLRDHRLPPRAPFPQPAGTSTNPG